MTTYAEQNHIISYLSTITMIWYHSEKSLGDISCMCVYVFRERLSHLYISILFPFAHQSIEVTHLI